MKSFSASTITSPVNLAFSALLSVILISSCSEPATVGLDLAPGNNQIGVFYQEFELPAEMILLDSFNTTNSSVLLAGNEADPFFGKTQSIGYSRVYIDVTDARPRTDAILDSVFFDIAVTGADGVDLSSPKKLSVHKLTETFLDTLYFNFDHLGYETSPIASGQFLLTNSTDSVFRLPLERNFALELFEKMKRGSEFDNLFNFRSYFKGIAVKGVDENNSTTIVSLGFKTGIFTYFHYEGDTVPSMYEITTASSRSFNGIYSDRSGTPLEVIKERGKSYKVGNTVGMKATAGFSIKLDTSPIDVFLDSLNRVTFNQVVLELGEINSQAETHRPLQAFTMIMLDQNDAPLKSTITNSNLYIQRDGQPQTQTDSNGNVVPSNTFTGAAEFLYNSTNKIYAQGLTSHVNALYREQLQRTNWNLYGTGPSISGDAYKRSLRQFTVDKSKIKVKVIFSKTL
jgi:hypothetical protein